MKRLSFLLTVFCLLFTAVDAAAQAPDSNNAGHRLTIIDPYADVHSGPGRGYPVFYAIEQGETVDIIARRPDWYEIRLASGKTGWVSAAQISRTIQQTGEPADLPSVSFGDYLENSFQVGYSFGQFFDGELKNSNYWSASAGYRVASWLGAEGEYGKVYGDDIRGSFYGLNVLIEPLSRWRLSPYILLGTGRMQIDSQPKLVPLTIEESDYNIWGVGTNFYAGRNFLVRAEYRSYQVSTDDKDVDLATWKIGFSSFF